MCKNDNLESKELNCFGSYSYTHIICIEKCGISQSCKNKSACSSPQPVPKCFGDYGKEKVLCNDKCDLAISCEAWKKKEV